MVTVVPEPMRLVVMVWIGLASSACRASRATPPRVDTPVVSYEPADDSAIDVVLLRHSRAEDVVHSIDEMADARDKSVHGLGAHCLPVFPSPKRHAEYVTPDLARNALVLHGPRDDRAALRRLVELLDAESEPVSLPAGL